MGAEEAVRLLPLAEGSDEFANAVRRFYGSLWELRGHIRVLRVGCGAVGGYRGRYMGSPMGSGVRNGVWDPQWGLGSRVCYIKSGVRNGAWGPQWGLGSTMGSGIPSGVWGWLYTVRALQWGLK